MKNILKLSGEVTEGEFLNYNICTIPRSDESAHDSGNGMEFKLDSHLQVKNQPLGEKIYWIYQRKERRESV
jgi:hypothetical protein